MSYLDVLLPLIGVLIGAGVSLVGIHLQNKESKKSREFELKKSTFANAVDSIVQTNQVIMQIPSLPIDELGKRFSDANLGSALAKLNLTVSLEIIKETTEYQNIFLDKWFALLLEKQPMDTHISDLNLTQALLQEEQKRFQDIITHLRSVPMANQAEYEANLKLLNEVQQRMNKLYDDQSRLLTLRENERLRLTKLCMEALIDLSTPLNKALILARKELELPTEDDAFKRIMEESLTRTKTSFEAFISKVEEMQAQRANQEA